jgi:small subunit ribosomal protein S17
MDKTVVVIVEIRNWVNKYRTWHTKLRKYMAHDMENTCNIGDVVKIEQIPQRVSKNKRFNVIEVLQREKIVVEDSSAAAAQQSLEVEFTNRPAWASLSPAVAQEISSATSAYASYYEISDAAHALARRLPGWDERIEVYRTIHGVKEAPEDGEGKTEHRNSDLEISDRDVDGPVPSMS